MVSFIYTARNSNQYTSAGKPLTTIQSPPRRSFRYFRRRHHVTRSLLVTSRARVPKRTQYHLAPSMASVRACNGVFATVTSRTYSHFATCAALRTAPFSTFCNAQALNIRINFNRESQLMRARAARRMFVFPLPHLLSAPA